MPCSLSPKAHAAINALFGSHSAFAASLLEQFLDTTSERVMLAAIKSSNGNLDELCNAIDLAHLDFRDLLVNAGFAHDPEAHLHWNPIAPCK